MVSKKNKLRGKFANGKVYIMGYRGFGLMPRGNFLNIMVYQRLL